MTRATIRGLLTLTAMAVSLACMKPNPYAELAEQAGDGDGDPGDGDTGDGDPGDGDPDPKPLPDFGQNSQSCASPDWFESECAECLSGTCCPVAELCAEAEGCECLVACKFGGGSPGACKNECGAKPGDIPEVGLLEACAAASCSDAC